MMQNLLSAHTHSCKVQIPFSHSAAASNMRCNFSIPLAILLLLLRNSHANLTSKNRQLVVNQQSTSPSYSWYYLSRKVFYVPLYYVIYFWIYFLYLIMKSINEHQVRGRKLFFKCLNWIPFPLFLCLYTYRLERHQIFYNFRCTSCRWLS